MSEAYSMHDSYMRWRRSINTAMRRNAVPDVNEPAIVVVWDPAIISEDQYDSLVAAIENVVQAHGGAGIKLLQTTKHNG